MWNSSSEWIWLFENTCLSYSVKNPCQTLIVVSQNQSIWASNGFKVFHIFHLYILSRYVRHGGNFYCQQSAILMWLRKNQDLRLPHPPHSNQLSLLSHRPSGCCFFFPLGAETSPLSRLTGTFYAHWRQRRGSKQDIGSRPRWGHILPSLHYGSYIYNIMVCCANKRFGCHGHAHLLDSAPGEELFACLLPAPSSTAEKIPPVQVSAS